MTLHGRGRVVVVLGLLVLVAQVRAERLDPERWQVTEVATGTAVRAATDASAETVWNDAWAQGLLVDLGRETVIHRIFLTPGPKVTASYTEVRVTFSHTPTGEGETVTRSYLRQNCPFWQVVAARRQRRAAGGDLLPPDVPAADLRFNPITARYLRFEQATPIAELEVYGSADRGAFAKGDAVVLRPDAPDVLEVAAEDLRYYVSELTGRPLPRITPAQETEYPGTLYRLLDLAPLATTLADETANRAAGKLPTGVNVERDGRVVVFRAWPYRNVAFSVWEFLRRQGVVWAASTDHADDVPAGHGVNLALLPLRCQPAEPHRKACFPVPDRAGFWLDDTLFFARNGYDESWGTVQRFLSAGEVPVDPVTQGRSRDAKDLKPEYAEGFEGHPHNLHAVVPSRVLEQHPDWCGQGADGQRRPPSKGGPGTFCFSNPELHQFVADKAVYWSGDRADARMTFRMVPGDGNTFCQCPQCLAKCEPFRAPSVAYCVGPRDMSGAYFHFVAEVAKRVLERRPQVSFEALAYADYVLPPRNLERLPENVYTAVCVYGVRNLPMSTGPGNAAVREYLETWAKKCARRGYWDYLLIHSEWRPLPMPVPMVTAMADRLQYLARLGMLGQGDMQADAASLVHNPWNRYAHPRLLWDHQLPVKQVLEEFFRGYYQEARAPMLAYYQALEEHLLRNQVSLEDFAYDLGPNPDMFTPALITTLRGHLVKAQTQARSWYVKPRVAQAQADFEWAVTAAGRRSLDRATAFANGKKQYLCPRRTAAVTVDGKLDDPGWQGITASSGFRVPGKDELAPAAEQTSFQATWDDTHLYLAVRCANPNMAKLPVTDEVWGAGMDNFECFLVPERVWTPAYYQIAVAASGKTWGPQRFLGVMWHRDETVVAPFTVAVQRGADGWTAEVAVPFASLAEGAPKAGDYWRFNLCRNGNSWSTLPMRMWHLYRDFDFIAFAAAKP